MKHKMVILIVTTLVIFSLSTKNEKIYYVPFNLPGDLKGMTIPPFGIFIEDQYRNEPDKPGSLVRHELVHWDQYKRMGLVGFYYNYAKGYLCHNSRFNHPMEDEARRVSLKCK